MGNPQDAHAFLGPSASARWMQCPRAPWLEALHPRRAGAAAQEGTDAHQVAELSFKMQREPVTFIGETLAREKAPDVAFLVTQEMAEAVQVFWDWTAQYRTEGWVWSAESRTVWHSVRWPAEAEALLAKLGLPFGPKHGPPLWGTRDFSAVKIGKGGDAEAVVVADYKHGAGKLVPAYGCSQLCCYTLDQHHCARGATRTASDVILAIIQPRCGDGDPDEWHLSLDEREEWHAKIMSAAQKALVAGPGGAFGVGGECDWCGGKGHCDGWVSRATEMCALEFADAPDTRELQAILGTGGPTSSPSVAGLSNEVLAKAYAERQVLIDLAKALEAETWRRLMARDLVPGEHGLKVVRGRAGNRAWQDPAAAREALEALGIDPRPEGVRSPAQIEAEFGKGRAAKAAFDAVGLSSLVTQSEGKPTVVLETAKGEALPPGAYLEGAEFTETDEEWEGN